jgi:hypothetical protein
MWTPQNRKRYDRSQLRYPSDLTDAEWAQPHRLPSPCPICAWLATGIFRGARNAFSKRSFDVLYSIGYLSLSRLKKCETFILPL